MDATVKPAGMYLRRTLITGYPFHAVFYKWFNLNKTQKNQEQQ